MSNLIGWSEKNFFGNRKKCSFQILASGVKLLENFGFDGLLPFSSRLPPQNVITTNDAGGNSYTSVTTDRRVMVYGSTSVEMPCFFQC